MPRTRACQVYAVMHYCKSLLWHASGLLFGFFLTEACDLRPMAMGLVLGGSLIGHALADLAVGRTLRHRIDSARTAGRAQRRWAPPTGLFFVLFALTPWVPQPWRIAFAAAALVGFRCTYTLTDVPLNAMVAFLAGTSSARTQLLALRNVLSGIASLSIASAGAPLLLMHPNAPLAYLVGAIVIAAAMVGAACWLGTTDLPGRAGEAKTPARTVPAADARALGLVLSVAAMLVFGHTVFQATEPYAAAFAGAGAGVMIWEAMGSILSQPAWVVANVSLGERRAASAAATCAAMGAVLLLCTARDSAIGKALTGLCFGVATGGLWLMLWRHAVQAAAASGTSWSIALLTATSKAAQGLAAICTGWVLGTGAYRAAFVDPLSPPSLLMVGGLALIGLCGVALALRRPALGAGVAPPSAAARPSRDQAIGRRGAVPARGCRPAGAG